MFLPSSYIKAHNCPFHSRRRILGSETLQDSFMFLTKAEFNERKRKQQSKPKGGVQGNVRSENEKEKKKKKVTSKLQ